MKASAMAMLMCVAGATTALAGPGDTLEFEDLTAFTGYNNGDTFTTEGIDVDVIDFTFSSGTTFSSGGAEVSDFTNAGAGQGMFIFNANLDFQLPFPLSVVSFGFDDGGGNVNLWVNNQLLNANDMISFDGTVVNGVAVSVMMNAPGSSRGMVTLQGNITQFATGGQEYAIDDVRFVPAPGALALLGLGGLAATRRRR